VLDSGQDRLKPSQELADGMYGLGDGDDSDGDEDDSDDEQARRHRVLLSVATALLPSFPLIAPTAVVMGRWPYGTEEPRLFLQVLV